MNRKAPSRLTKNGKRRGRPPKYLAPHQLDNPAPLARLALEETKAKPDPVAGSENLWIVRAINGEGKPGYALNLKHQLTAAGAGDRELASVKRRLARVREQIRDRDGVDWLPGAGPNKPEK